MLVEEMVRAALAQRELDVEQLHRSREAQLRSEDSGGVRILTNTARVLATVAREPATTMRDIARQCGQTERAVWEQLHQLERAGLLSRRREGRRNRYEVDDTAVQRQLVSEGLIANPA